MSSFRELINKYKDVVISVYRLGIDCCGDDCIIRVTDWSYVRGLKCRVHGLMIDPEQVNELLRRPSLIKLLLQRGVNRLIAYPCITQDRVMLLSRLGFTVMNYFTGDDCSLTQSVVVHLDAYKIIDLAGRGVTIYVHLYRPYIRGVGKSTYDINSIFDTALEYLRRSGIKIHLILDELYH
ncbi:hypothetical protein JCM16161A_07240 [Vulcanisaeta sp. JCM 16161]|uniref:hypothetical protein n=1 Tax=Vulcanisaeta sp. JCM 16161 TaxID=1295372 RepID=UPI0006CFE80B|nr:hypothetical protein [Vulcanisaeta sp. JCM 16161]